MQNNSRRDFLKIGGLGALGLMLTLSQSCSSSTPGKKLRIGIVGGGFGCAFQFHEHPNCIVEAVSDLRPDRLKKLMNTYKCSKSYRSLEELVKDKKIDAVAIFTEAPNHVKHVLECLKHGKHVLCAVPAIFGSIAEAETLFQAVKKSGLLYMMAETSYYHQSTISARNFYKKGDFGTIFYCESEYQHDGLQELFNENGKRTWRYAIPPMYYPTHCTSNLISVTGERLTHVSCQGWGDDDPILKENSYKNPFWNESALFKTDRGNSFRVNVWWKGAHMGCERAQWIGNKMSFYSSNPVGSPSTIIHSTTKKGNDDAGFVRTDAKREEYLQPNWWETDLLPEPLRHQSAHDGSHTFITHEFVDACLNARKPAVDIHEALAYTVPGVIAHESALRGGVLLEIPQFD